MSQNNIQQGNTVFSGVAVQGGGALPEVGTNLECRVAVHRRPSDGNSYPKEVDLITQADTPPEYIILHGTVGDEAFSVEPIQPGKRYRVLYVGSAVKAGEPLRPAPVGNPGAVTNVPQSSDGSQFAISFVAEEDAPVGAFVRALAISPRIVTIN